MHSLFACAFGAGLLLAPWLAAAQGQQAPARLDNIWDSEDHPMPRAQTHTEEKAAGVALPPAERRTQDDEVERLDRQVLQGADEGPGAGGP